MAKDVKAAKKAEEAAAAAGATTKVDEAKETAEAAAAGGNGDGAADKPSSVAEAKATAGGSGGGGAKRPSPQERARMAASKRRARASGEALGAAPGRSSAMKTFYGAAVVALVGAWLTFIYRAVQPVPPSPAVLANVTATRVQLSDGRHVAVHEMGARADFAKYHVMVLHDVKGCRLSMLPNVTQDLLERLRVRLVSYDRPGYGQSDAFSRRTLKSEARDVAAIAHAMGMHVGSSGFHVVGVGLGGVYAWACLRYIPDKVQGIAMLGPWGDVLSPDFHQSEKIQAWQSLPRSDRIPLLFARLTSSPWFLNLWFKVIVPRVHVYNGELPDWLTGNSLAKRPDESGAPLLLVERDLAVLNTSDVKKYYNEMEAEGLRQGLKESWYRDIILAASRWPFHLKEIAEAVFTGENPFEGPVHIWQGSEDHVAAPVLQHVAARLLPFVTVHDLEEAGHYFFHEDSSWPKTILSSLLGVKKSAEEAAAEYQEVEAASKVWG